MPEEVLEQLTQETPEPAAAPEQTGSAFFPPQAEPPPADGEPQAEGAEPTPDAEPPVEPAPDPLARSYEDLAKRDRELQQRQERLRAQESDLRTWQTLQQQAKEDPGAALRSLGIDPFTLSDRLLGIEPSEPEQAQQIPKDVLTRQEAQQMVQQQLQHQQQVWQQQQIIQQQINADEHELLSQAVRHNPQLVGDIYNEAVQRFQESGTLPDIQALLREREERETANLFASLDRVMKLGKVKERYKLGGGNETTAPKKEPTNGAPRQTLSQTQKEEPRQDERPMTEEERWKAFHQAIKGDIAKADE